MITGLEIIQADRGQYLYKEREMVQRTKGLKADKGIKSQSMPLVSEQKGNKGRQGEIIKGTAGRRSLSVYKGGTIPTQCGQPHPFSVTPLGTQISK